MQIPIVSMAFIINPQQAAITLPRDIVVTTVQLSPPMAGDSVRAMNQTKITFMSRLANAMANRLMKVIFV